MHTKRRLADRSFKPTVGPYARAVWCCRSSRWTTPLNESGRRIVDDWIRKWRSPLALIKGSKFTLRLYIAAVKLGVDIEEIESYSWERLIYAVSIFDPDRGVLLHTHVCWWLRSGLEQIVRAAVGRARTKSISIDAVIDDPTDFNLHMALIDDSAIDPCDRAEHLDQLEFARHHMQCLTDRERRIIELRADGLGLRDAGAAEGICKERARQIEFSAMRKIQASINGDLAPRFIGPAQPEKLDSFSREVLGMLLAGHGPSSCRVHFRCVHRKITDAINRLIATGHVAIVGRKIHFNQGVGDDRDKA